MQDRSFLVNLHNVLDYELFTIAGTPINLATISIFLLVVAITFVLSAMLRRAARRFLEQRNLRDEGSIEVTLRLAHFVIMALGVGIAIHTIGINLSALFAAGALFAVGLGFAMQTIAQNFVSGVILMGERTIKPKDILQVEGQMVQVMSMGHRAIVARTLDDEDLIIPNSVLVQSTVKNYTLRDQLYRIRVDVGVVYGSDMRLVRRVLQEAAEGIEERHHDKKPVIFMTAFANSSVSFEVSIWIASPWRARKARSHLHETIWWALKDAGVTIAFPQLDVHFDPDVSTAIAAMNRS